MKEAICLIGEFFFVFFVEVIFTFWSSITAIFRKGNSKKIWLILVYGLLISFFLFCRSIFWLVMILLGIFFLIYDVCFLIDDKKKEKEVSKKEEETRKFEALVNTMPQKKKLDDFNKLIAAALMYENNCEVNKRGD